MRSGDRMEAWHVRGVAKIIRVAKMSVIAGALEFVGYTIVDYVSSGGYDVGDSVVASVVAALFMGWYEWRDSRGE